MGSLILVGPPAAWEGWMFENTSPSTISESSRVPPKTLTIFISFKSTFVEELGSITYNTALTAIGENYSV